MAEDDNDDNHTTECIGTWIKVEAQAVFYIHNITNKIRFENYYSFANILIQVIIFKLK